MISSDTGTSIVKDGPGQLILSNANTYTGTTAIEDGRLTIRNAKALGFTDGSAGTGTTVNATPGNNKFGTLQLDAGAAAGFIVENERLVLNNNGFTGIGALHNLDGDNQWTGNIILNSNTAIGVAAGTKLTVGEDLDQIAPLLDGTGIVSGGGQLRKIQTGTLIFTSANTYTSSTQVEAGILNIRDSRGLGSIAAGTTVFSGAALELEVDIKPDSVALLNTNTLIVAESIALLGTGFTGDPLGACATSAVSMSGTEASSSWATPTSAWTPIGTPAPPPRVPPTTWTITPCSTSPGSPPQATGA